MRIFNALSIGLPMRRGVLPSTTKHSMSPPDPPVKQMSLTDHAIGSARCVTSDAKHLVARSRSGLKSEDAMLPHVIHDAHQSVVAADQGTGVTVLDTVSLLIAQGWQSSVDLKGQVSHHHGIPVRVKSL